MARIFDYVSETKPIVASTTQTLTFTSTQIPSQGLAALFFSFTSTGATALTLNEVTRVRVKANGAAFIDITIPFLRAYIFRFSIGGYAMPVAAITSSAATAQNVRRFTVPFYILDAMSKDAADVCQFPPNSLITVEVEFTTVANQTGALQCGFMQTNVGQRCYPKLYQNAMNIGSGQSIGVYSFSDEGIIEGVGLATIGMLRAKLVLGGQQIIQLPGEMANDADAFDANSDSILWEAQQMDCDWSRLAAATAGVDATPNSPIFFDVHSGLNAPQGSSRVELQTGASWAGAANEVCLYSVVPI